MTYIEVLKEMEINASERGRIAGIAEVVDKLETIKYMTNGISKDELRDIIAHFNCIITNYVNSSNDEFWEKSNNEQI